MSGQWSVPFLIVLAGSQGDERVLEGCKTEDWVVHGPGDGYSECETRDYCYADCQTVVTS